MKEYLKSINNLFLIFIILLYIWWKYFRCNEFEIWFSEVCVDFDDRSEGEKWFILEFLMKWYDVFRELVDIICKLKCDLLDFIFNSIGFLVLLFWICK